MRPGSRLGAIAALVASVLGLGACGSSVESLAIPSPPPTAATTTTTAPPPTSTLPEGAVVGVTTTTTPRVRPGNSSLNGTVFGPQGPVKGATVLAERIVDGTGASVTAVTAADGSWTISGIVGGRYRLRAWLVPNLAATTPQYVYLSGGQVLSMSIQVSQFQGPVTSTAVSPSQPIVGFPVNLAVQVTNPEVGSDGVVTSPGLAGWQVSLSGDPGWDVAGTGTGTTGANGEVVFQLTCTFAGYNPLSVTVGSQPPAPVQLPACNPPPTTTTTSTPTTSTTTTSGASTTVPGGTTTTTSTPQNG